MKIPFGLVSTWPGTPILTAANPGVSSVEVIFDCGFPRQPGTTHSVEYRISGLWTVFGTTSGSSTSIKVVVTKLADGTRYEFRVRSFRGNLFSDYSNVLVATTPASSGTVDPGGN